MNGDVLSMKIAVCDDDPVIREAFCKMVDQILNGKYCSAYVDVDEMFQEIEEGLTFDIVFLDIEWDGEERGITFAGKINQMCPGTAIIFLTGYTERYLQSAFLCTSRISGFLVKPVQEEVLRGYLHKIIEENIKNNQNKFEIKENGVCTAVLFQEILYLESFGHRIKITVDQGKIYYCYNKLETLAAAFPESFVQCHKSYLINMQKVVSFKPGDHLFIMENGVSIPISKARYHDAKEKFRSYRNENPRVREFR